MTGALLLPADDREHVGLEPGCKVTFDTGDGASRAGLVDSFQYNVPDHPSYGEPLRPLAVVVAEHETDERLTLDPAQVLRDRDDCHAARQGRVERLLEVYPFEVPPEYTDTVGRYCGIQRLAAPPPRTFLGIRIFGWPRQAPEFSHHYGDDFDHVAMLLSIEIIDGCLPEAVWDLDTGERIDLHVASPAVTLSEDRHACLNPLDPVEWSEIVSRYGEQHALEALRK